MINLQKIFNNNNLHSLHLRYKQALYDAVINCLKSSEQNSSNLKSLQMLLTETSGLTEISKHLSTFFYATVKQWASENSPENKLKCEFLLCVLAFDSLFKFLDDTFSIDVECPFKSNFLLPVTGVCLNLLDTAYTVTKRTGSVCLVINNENEALYSLNSEYISGEAIRILDLNEKDCLYWEIIKKHASCDLMPEEKQEQFCSKLNSAISALKNLGSEMSYHLNRIEVIVPMAFVAEDVTKSFTLSGIPHVIFLSDSNSYIKLMENFIHESLHDELNIFMNYYDLILAESIRYYSSWRNDPRPIRGLLHAIYVFTVILDFYHRILQTSKDRFNEAEIKFIVFRYSLIYYELGLAFYQLEKESSELTSLGSFFIAELKKRYNVSVSNFLYKKCPSSILAHIATWRQTNSLYTIHIPEPHFFNTENLDADAPIL